MTDEVSKNPRTANVGLRVRQSKGARNAGPLSMNYAKNTKKPSLNALLRDLDDARRDEQMRRGGTKSAEPIHKSPIPIQDRSALSVQEAADLLGICRPVLYKFIRSGDLPCFTLGRRRLVRRQALEEFQLAREAQHTAALRADR